MDYQKLKEEIIKEEYSKLSNATIVDKLYVEIEIPVENISGKEFFESLDMAEYEALSSDDKALVRCLMSMEINLNNENVKKVVGKLGNKTTANLVKVKLTNKVSQLGLDPVGEHHVAFVK